VLTETDLALINALQVSPRADWVLVGKALGISGSTVSRRWEALNRDGTAWVTVHRVRDSPVPSCSYI